jgi:hypothetical protein
MKVEAAGSLEALALWLMLELRCHRSGTAPDPETFTPTSSSVWRARLVTHSREYLGDSDAPETSRRRHVHGDLAASELPAPPPRSISTLAHTQDEPTHHSSPPNRRALQLRLDHAILAAQ